MKCAIRPCYNTFKLLRDNQSQTQLYERFYLIETELFNPLQDKLEHGFHTPSQRGRFLHRSPIGSHTNHKAKLFMIKKTPSLHF